MAFHIRNCVGPRDDRSFAVQWLACALPCRRFADALADVCARLRADVGRYSFTVWDLHPLLLAGLPAHSETLHRSRPSRGKKSLEDLRLKARHADPTAIGYRSSQGISDAPAGDVRE